MTRAVQQTTRDLRRHNRSALLTSLYLHGQRSRLELVGTSGLSSATVSNVISDLIADGVVVEAGSVESDGGRPRTLLRVNPGHGHVVGVDIGETHIEVGLFDCTLDTVATATYPIASTGLEPAEVARLVRTGIDAVAATPGVDPARLLGIGVGVPGSVRPGGVVHAPTFGWRQVPLGDMLAPGIAAPLHVDNCARTLGQAEMWRGAGRGANRAVVALLGVGVGAALATGLDGQRGSTSTTEWGHTVVQAGGLPCRCGSRGCLEAYLGAEGILARYAELPGSTPLTAADTESRLQELADLATVPGPAAEVIASTAEYLGVGIANLVNLLTPDRVVLSGWVSQVLGVRMMPGVLDAARRHALSYLFEQTRVELGQLGPEAVALGAATLPISQFLAEGGAVPR
ncbi:ROK family transcriptional regulator [Kutzneria albida]|uniref:ROK family transcription regulator n=1 Tax=Kutzneria albida DSM 43870 TaxID=1449976 RepID=W5W035_9PSEU|nr:ROK family protein [Kutzneria albida]AHH94558.1 ROK family transcription regulator [Kutzneria albida DSM 43870]